MKPPKFEYVRPESLEEALEQIRRPGAKVLAGGQSLIPLLNLRLARPDSLVDIGRIPDLAFVRSDSEGNLRLGALVRHQALLTDQVASREAPLLGLALVHVGHVAIRNWGTLGGSLAHADPTAELPLAMVVLGARFRLQSVGSDRWVEAEEFFLGPFSTATREDEILTEVLVPRRPPEERCVFLEVSRRRGDFALVAVAALASQRGMSFAWSGTDGKPVLAKGDPVVAVRDRQQSDGYNGAALSVLAHRAIRAVTS